MVERTFHTWDYIVVSLVMMVSILIGIFHACTGGRQRTTNEFLMANRNMNPIPVAFSLVASFISAITFLGTPAENYIHGSMYWVFGLAYIGTGLATGLIFIPMFYRFNATSANEYLELRFNRTVRICGMLTFCLQMIIYMGIVIYAPALALSAVTDLSLWGSVLSIGIVCTFYTTIGGMKAVLWTDCFQVTVMFIGFFAIIIETSIRLGGMRKGWAIANEGGRIDFWDFNPDPTVRHTFWSVAIGGIWTWTAVYGVNQSQVQRYLTCGNEKRAKMALIMATFGMLFVVCAACLSGILMYAYYADCDPYKAKLVQSSDQLIPFLVMDLFGSKPGLPGLLVSACFSAALSTVSSGLNSLAAVTGEDIIKSIWPNMEEKKYTMVTKMLAAFYGVIAISMAFLASLLGSILQTALSIFGMVGGPLLGLFSLGMFFPWANSKGAVAGLVTGLVCAFWINIGSQAYPPIVHDPPRTVEGCLLRFPNNTILAENLLELEMEMPGPEVERPWIAGVYSLSYAWYSFTFWLITIVVGLAVSFCTGHNRASDINPKFMCSLVDKTCCCVPEEYKIPLRCGVQYEDKSGQEPEMAEVKYRGVSGEEADGKNGVSEKERLNDQEETI